MITLSISKRKYRGFLGNRCFEKVKLCHYNRERQKELKKCRYGFAAFLSRS